MKKNIITCLLTLFSWCLFAQTINLKSVSTDTVVNMCSQMKVKYSTTGTFNVGNAFVLYMGDTFGTEVPLDTIYATSSSVDSIFEFTWNTPYAEFPVFVRSTTPVRNSNYSPVIYFSYPELLLPFVDSVVDGNICFGNESEIQLLKRSSVLYEWTDLQGQYIYPVYNNSLTFPKFLFGTKSQTDTVVLYRFYSSEYGCLNSKYDTITLKVNPLIDLQGFDTTQSGCRNTTLSLTCPSTPHYFYTWYKDNHFVSNATSLNVYLDSSYLYKLYVIDTTTGCRSNYQVSLFSQAPPRQDICLLTVDTNSTHNIVIWEKSNLDQIDSFYVYKEVATDVYTKLASFGKHDLSEYHDYTSNPNITSFKYKITCLDTCGNETLLKETKYHTSIHLQYLSNGNLQWSPYLVEGSSTPISTYTVYKDASLTNDWVEIATLSGNQTTITDTSFGSTETPRYKVVANWSYSCTPSRSVNQSVSNIKTLNVNSIGSINNAIRLYPNPAQNMLYVYGVSIKSLSVINLLGEEINVSMQDNKVDVSNLATGIYTLVVNNNRVNFIKQ